MDKTSFIKKLEKFNMRNDRASGIKFIKEYLKKNPPSDDILLQLAFFLYHNATQRLYNNKQNQKEKEIIKSLFNESIEILESLIKKNSDMIFFNARIYLAQIYAILGDKKAVKLGKENYRIKPNLVTANRLADIYDRLNQNNKALWWYKKTERMSQNSTDEKILAKQGLANFYKKTGKVKLADQYTKETLSLIKGGGLKNKSMRKILKEKKSTD